MSNVDGMETSPAQVRTTSFHTAKRGYDTAEVDTFVAEMADALEAAQNETTAMEARARAAVARLQELAQSPGDGHGGESSSSDEPARAITPDESETISRTLLLAQRTADATVAEATAEADRVLAAARDDAASNLDNARAQTTQLLDEAREEARRAGEDERVQVESEVQSLLARRDFLESDVDHLEQFITAQRERVAAAATALSEIANRGPGGLGDLRKPLLSAADDSDTSGVGGAPALDDTAELDVVTGEEPVPGTDTDDESGGDVEAASVSGAPSTTGSVGRDLLR